MQNTIVVLPFQMKNNYIEQEAFSALDGPGCV